MGPSIYQHFRPEERPFIDQVLEWQTTVLDQYHPKLTDFLDPREQNIIRSVIGSHSELTIDMSGGINKAERRRALLLPPYVTVEPDEYKLCLFELNYPHRFATITHRELLGSLMGLGLRREKFGDLLFADGRIQFVAAAEIAEFIRLNLKQIGQHTVSCEPTAWGEAIVPQHHWQAQSGTVSSLRLDVVLAEIYNLPRGKVSPAIQQQRVKVNWRIVDKPAYMLRADDYLSLRKVGRSHLSRVGEPTKKGRLPISYELLK